MGVTGLWKLIEPCGQIVPVETLEGKTLAVDISIWLHQVVKGFQDNKGSALENAHLLGLFHRLCKLLYYRIKPIFVFDGEVPLMKRETIAKRNLKRSQLNSEADRIRILLLQSLAKEQVVQQALGSKAATELLKVSPPKSRATSKFQNVDEMFMLPDASNNIIEYANQSTPETEGESPIDDSKTKFYCGEDLQSIDIKSKHFQHLPADIRHEILVDIKETRKQSSWGKLHELPSKGSDFSSFQMQKLLKRRQVQECLEETEKEMDSVRSLTFAELEHIFNEESIVEEPVAGSKHISSDANTRFLLIRDLKKTLTKASFAKDPQTSTLSKNCLEKGDVLQLEYDHDVQKAIELSLEKDSSCTENKKEVNCKLRKDQRKVLGNSAVGLAKAYMIEHAGMNFECIEEFLQCNQTCSDDEFDSTSMENNQILETNAKIINANQKTTTMLHNNDNCVNDKALIYTKPLPVEVAETENIGIISDSSEDSTSEEAPEGSISKNSEKATENTEAQKSLEIFIDSSKTTCSEEDIFRDVFSMEIENRRLTNATQILQGLKKQAEEATTIDLADIDIDPSIIVISGNESWSNSIETAEKSKYKSDPSDLHKNILKFMDVEQEEKSERQTTLSTKHISETSRLGKNKIMGSKANIKSQPGSDRLVKPFDLKKEEFSDQIVTESINKIEPTSSTIVTNVGFEVLKVLSQKINVTNLAGITSEKVSKSASGTNLQSKVSDIGSANVISNVTTISSGLKKSETDKKNEIIDNESIITESAPVPKTQNLVCEFYEPQYITKRTSGEFKQNDLVVKSAFLVNKNSKNNEPKSSKKKSSTKTKVHQRVENITANLLDKNNTEELNDVATILAREKTTLEIAKNRQERMGMTISERMSSECMQLLHLFGVPFIVAPMEAEAQCAFLDSMGLTNGTITDDSDIWLFGGQTVYKNFFAQNKHVMEFQYNKIAKSFNMDRNKLIQLALLVGSDYTTGINGIGPVTALEIIASFSSTKTYEKHTHQQTSSILESLLGFREWWKNVNSSKFMEHSKRHTLRNKLKNIELSDAFPNPAVVEQYLTPMVDKSQETFCWGAPDIESIKEFTRTKFGWTRLKTDEFLDPVLKKNCEKTSQSTITNYFAVKRASSSSEIVVSKRVQNAINKMSTSYQSELKNDNAIAGKQKRRKPTENFTTTNGPKSRKH